MVEENLEEVCKIYEGDFSKFKDKFVVTSSRFDNRIVAVSECASEAHDMAIEKGYKNPVLVYCCGTYGVPYFDK
jgi:hypothetical protein